MSDGNGRGWWQRRREARDLNAASLPSAMSMGGTAAGPIVSHRNALAIPAAWSCVRALVSATASLPLHVFRRSESGRVRADDTPVSRLLELPAPGVTQPGFLGHVMTSLQLHGEAFISKWRDPAGAVAQLGLFDPSLVEVEVVGGMPMYTVTISDPQPRTVTLTPADVVHVRGPVTLDGVRGASPIRVVREAFGFAQAVTEHGSRTFANGASPSGVLTVPDGVHVDEGIQNLKEAWEARHRGASNAGRIALLTGDVKFQAVGWSNADAEWLATCHYSDAQIARVFGLPPWVINAQSSDSLTYSTVSEQARAFVIFSLRPWLVAIEAALAADAELFPPEQRLYPMFELDALLRGDPVQRAQVYAQALDPTRGWMRREEVRQLEDLPAEPDRPEPRPEPEPVTEDREEEPTNA